MARDVAGVLYIGHLDPPYRHARHYLGWSEDPATRWREHVAGAGSPLIRAAVGAGGAVRFYELGPGTRRDERRLHRERHAPRHCPECRA